MFVCILNKIAKGRNEAVGKANSLHEINLLDEICRGYFLFPLGEAVAYIIPLEQINEKINMVRDRYYSTEGD